MVKRQADKQLTDRNCDDLDDDEAPSTGLMKSASPQAISQRKIRALPKKTGPSPSIGIPTFGGPPPLSSAKNTLNPFGQAFSPASPANLFGSLSHSTTAKTTSPFSLSSSTTMSANSSPFSTKATDPPNVQAITKFYASLRGLNLSVLKAFEDLTKKDAFVDLSSSFDHIKTKYNQHRSQIQSEFEKAQASTAIKTQPSDSTERSATLSSSALPAPSPTNLFGSQPPLSQAPYDKETSNSSSTTGSTALGAKAASRSGAFTMAAPMRPSPLRYESENAPLGTPPPSLTESGTKDAVNFAPIIKHSKPEVSSSAPPNSLNKQSTFQGLRSSDTTDPSTSVSGDVKPKPASLFGSTVTSNTPSSIFGSAAASKPFSFVNPSASSPDNKPPSVGFGFGAGGDSNVSVFGGFRAPKSSSASSPPKNGFNPVGFSFGNSPPTSSSLIKTPDLARPEEESAPDQSTSASNDAVPTALDEPQPLSTSSDVPTVDAKKGEEDEETIFETIARVYAYIDKKQEDGSLQKGWVGWATSSVKLNQHKTTRRSRLFARSQVNQNILINFFVKSDTPIWNRTNSVEISGFNAEGTQPQLFRIRPMQIERVEEFIDAIKRATAEATEK